MLCEANLQQPGQPWRKRRSPTPAVRNDLMYPASYRSHVRPLSHRFISDPHASSLGEVFCPSTTSGNVTRHGSKGLQHGFPASTDLGVESQVESMTSSIHRKKMVWTLQRP